MFHAFGYAVAVLGCYTHGATVCPVDSFDARRVLQTIDRERCTTLHGVPTMFQALLECPEFEEYDLRSLRTGIMGGVPCPPSLMCQVTRDMHLSEVTIAYGLTEASPGITMTSRDTPLDERSITVGHALPDMEVSIVDPVTRREMAPGERGELRVRGYNVMLGYFGDAEATRAVIDDEGWLYTGDEASVDGTGVYRITGRLKDVIVSGGENIAPVEVANCLREHADVVDAPVYGVPDAVLGERVAAAIRVERREDRQHATEEELIGWCRTRLAPFKVPTAIPFVTEFPLTPSGKVQAFRLRKEHLQSVLLSQTRTSAETHSTDGRHS